MPFRINLVEDEKSLRDLLTSYLEREQYEVRSYSRGDEALEALGTADLWILDISLPGMDGFELLNRIRENDRNIPVIYMSARDRDIDRVVGLEVGADDYLAKPFLPRELIIRTERLLSRIYGDNRVDREEKPMDIGPFELYKDKRMLLSRGEKIDLTSREFDLILFLGENRGRAFSRDQLIGKIWGEGYHASERVVDDLVRRIRKKLPELPLETIYGFGYRMCE